MVSTFFRQPVFEHLIRVNQIITRPGGSAGKESMQETLVPFPDWEDPLEKG